MRAVPFFILFILCLKSFAQDDKSAFNGEEWQPPYKLIKPQGWDVERFPIPIEFAPAIPYKGVEDIRFTPGWGNQASDEYWTYLFLWYLEAKQVLTKELLQQYLKDYYTGLVKRNIVPRKIPDEKVIPVVTSFKDENPEAGYLKRFSGNVSMLDYMAQKPIVLNCRVFVKSCPEKNNTFVFFEISPQPFSHTLWKKLDEIRNSFACSLD